MICFPRNPVPGPWYSTCSAALLSILLFAAIPAFVIAQNEDKLSPNARAIEFISRHEAVVRPLELEINRLWWAANITGKEADFQAKQAAEEKLDAYLADAARFAELKAIKEAGVSDPLLARQIHILYLQYLEKQVPRELLARIVAKSNAIERAFNVFRPKLGGQELTDNQVRRVLRESRDSSERRAVWEAGKAVGPVVLADLLELIELRNQAARHLGFSDYYAMRLVLLEQDEKQLMKLFDELEELTRGPFRRAKQEIDAALAAAYGIAPEELRPWHYHDPFFQEPPTVLGELPDEIFRQLDPVDVCRRFYAGIGLPVDDVLQRSDLYERPGKNPHAFSQDMDREGDVRILENVVPGREWLTTTLHELGHAVYSKYTDRRLPYVLRTEAHPLCTEGIAMMFERLAEDVDWLQAFGAKISEPERFRAAARKLQRNRLLVFARFAQVMFRFEREMYRNPRQELNRLWWDMVEKYQEVRRPESRDAPDFAAKYHIVGAPAYYHNYMLGEMFASQVYHALLHSLKDGGEVKRASVTRLIGNPAVGLFLRERVFAPGLSLDWNELTRHATGAELSPKAFAEDLQATK